jgi:hypothetical protein
MGVVVLIGGCPPVQSKCKIIGWVTDDANTPLPFVQVTAGGMKARTDGSGLFSLESAGAGNSVTVTFSLKGYATTSRSLVPKSGAANTVNVVMKQLSEGTDVADASTGGNFSKGGTSLTVPPGAIDTGGAKSAGATVHITTVNGAVDAELASLPGGLSATSGNQNGILDVHALVNISVDVNGASGGFTAGSSATIRIRLAAGSSLHAGDTVGLWYFDLESGAWVQSGTGTVVQSGGSLYVEGTITHCGWWCCAIIQTGLYTISGHVYDAADQPVENALIVARGIDYHGTTWTMSGKGGAYSIRALPNAQVRLKLILPGAYYVCDTLNLSTGAAGESIANQDLAPDFKSCVQGHVTEEDGATPVAGAHVYSSAGGSAVTESDGSFCMAAPGSTNVAVYVLGGPPVFAHTPATATCEGGDGADVTLSVRYPKDGDRLGFVFGSLRNVTIPFVGNRTYLSTSALFYSGFKGEQFAPYDPDAPLNTYAVYTAEPSASFDWGSVGLQLAFDIDFDINETFNLEDGEVPSITKIGALDAGSPADVTNGTASFNLLRPLDFFYPFEGNGSLQDLGYALLEPWMGGFYFQQGLWSDDFAAGDTVSFSWPGGIDMGAFTATTILPGSLNLTAPADLSEAFSDDALANGLTVTWDTAGQGSYVTLILESIVSQGLFGPVSVGAVVCKAADDGEYVIPAEALAELPIMNSGGTQINYLFAKRHTITKADVPLTFTEGTGYVVVAVDSPPVKMWSLDWRVIKK